MVIGTLQYMAPEQTFGTSRAGARADQYSLGAILYEAVTGHLPFEDESFYALLEKIRHAPLPPMRSLVQDIPLALDEAVARALSRAPEHRFEGVRAFATSPDAHGGSEHGVAVGARLRAGRRVGRRAFGPGRPPAPVMPSAQTSSIRISTQLPCKPGASPFHIKGIAYRGIVQLVKSLEGGIDAVEAEIDDERLLGFLRQPFLASSWHDILPMMPVNAAIARVLGKPLDVLAREQGTSQARFDGEHVYRRLFDKMTFENMPPLMARFERQYYDFGDSHAELVAPGHVLLRRLGVPEFITRWYGPMHAAYAEQVLRTKGATFVESTVSPPTDAGKRDGFPVVDIDTHLLWS